MSAADRPGAARALAAGRAAATRLADPARDPEDLAADILESWTASEEALRSLAGGTALTGQALVRELRQRDQLALEQAHHVLDFLAARDRAARTEYRVTAADAAAARAGFAAMEQAASGAPIAAAPVAPVSAADYDSPSPADSLPREGRGPGPLLAGLLAVLLLGAGIAWYMTRGGSSSSGSVDQGIALYRSGKREEARRQFALSARDNPDLAVPHLYLGRIAREEGDVGTARTELEKAIRLDTSSAAGYREMGALLLSRGNNEGARRFYVRALQRDPADASSGGYLGCSLIRLGRASEGARFIQRAGQGPWESCLAVQQRSGAAQPRR